jgi:hypothetical protein
MLTLHLLDLMVFVQHSKASPNINGAIVASISSPLSWLLKFWVISCGLIYNPREELLCSCYLTTVFTAIMCIPTSIKLMDFVQIQTI